MLKVLYVTFLYRNVANISIHSCFLKSSPSNLIPLVATPVFAAKHGFLLEADGGGDVYLQRASAIVFTEQEIRIR